MKKNWKNIMIAVLIVLIGICLLIINNQHKTTEVLEQRVIKLEEELESANELAKKERDRFRETYIEMLSYKHLYESMYSKEGVRQ